MDKERFIKVPVPDSDETDQAFEDLMSLSEDILNSESSNFKKLSPKDVEDITVETLRQATKKIVCFKPEDIILVSGFQFPDIKIKPCYGVEVKTSQSGWSSIGSSIIESTRIPDIRLIYMVFGNLKEHPYQFKCKPYGDVLTDIKVTHSPRYTIDMDAETSVFNAMNTTYNQYRRLDDKKKIELAQIYAREKLKKNGATEMPWWIKDLNENSLQGNIRIWNSLSQKEKRNLVAQCMVLFPELLSPKTSPVKYNEATLWLCSYHQIVSPNMRDNFSAGGRIEFQIDKDEILKIPAVFGKIKLHLEEIKRILNDPSEDFEIQLSIYNPSLKRFPVTQRYEEWIKNLIKQYQDFRICDFLNYQQ